MATDKSYKASGGVTVRSHGLTNASDKSYVKSGYTYIPPNLWNNNNLWNNINFWGPSNVTIGNTTNDKIYPSTGVTDKSYKSGAKRYNDPNVKYNDIRVTYNGSTLLKKEQ